MKRVVVTLFAFINPPIGKDTFCVLSFIRLGSGIGDSGVDAGVVLGGRHGCGTETWLEEVELLL